MSVSRPMLSPGTAPTERAHSTASRQHTAVSMAAALPLDMENSSRKNTVPISCIDMVEVSAAKTSNT